MPGGWDNRIFRLGEHFLVRLPSAEKYASQVEKEQRWLPKLKPLLPLEIPKPVAIGHPGSGYPWKWSVYEWLPGKTVSELPSINLSSVALSLAKFLKTLQSLNTQDSPSPGSDNFYRGEALLNYDAETRQVIHLLKNKIDPHAAIEAWEIALATCWKRPPVWVHGDISTGNLLMLNKKLSVVIDFGMLAHGNRHDGNFFHPSLLFV